MIRQGLAFCACAAVAAILGACAIAPSREPAPDLACSTPAPCPVCEVCPAAPVVAPRVPILEPVGFKEIPDWKDDDLEGTFGALRLSCQRLRTQPSWRDACAATDDVGPSRPTELRRWFEANFVPHRVSTPEGDVQGLITGYYEPLLRGSRNKHGPFRFPLYAPPDDLLVIDLASINPDLRNMRLRGRLDGRRVVPYYSRADIERGIAPVAGKEIVWVDDAIEAFFLQIQGSGRVQLDNGEMVRIGYADQNGHPYQSIGRYLVERGELKLEEASMGGIKAWAADHPSRVDEMLNFNPSYVFFREAPQRASASGSLVSSTDGPIGALGVPLTPRRSIAVDPRYVPLGAPVFVSTTWPNAQLPLARLMFAQDTGGAIRGPVRADFFWGFGAEAGAIAGKMRQRGKMWVLLPRGYPLPRN